ncbi:MAG: peptide chain release factor-like protein [Oligoflexia bacterium]|nr:peptide chain release factor-like protein [Oligoflexia bacterium]
MDVDGRCLPLSREALTRDALQQRCVVEFVRGSGPGGQHRNKRYTGVRLTDPISGTVVLATERRSQARNLEIAFVRMTRRLAALAHRPTPRKATRPGRGAVRRRLRAKRRRAETKALRRPPDDG